MKSYFLILASLLFFAACKPAVTEDKKEAVTAKENCPYARNEMNADGKSIKMVEDALFITLANSDTALVRKTGNADYLKGYMSCVRIDTVIGMYFDFKIFSADAYREYGMIRKDNKISFILKSGKTVVVPFAVTFSGNTNLTSDITEYKTYAHVSPDEAGMLKTSELQRVTISWAKMEEEYKVVNPGIFMSQIPCVE